MKELRDFYRGISLAGKGISFFYTHTSLWKYALLPLLLTVLVYIGLGYLGGKFSGFLIAQIREICQGIPDWISFLVPLWIFVTRFMVFALWVLILIFCSGSLYELAGGLFFDRLIEKMVQKNEFSLEAGCCCEKMPGISFGFMIKSAFAMFLYSMGSLLLFLVLLICGAFVPFMPLLIVLIMGYRLGVGYLTLPGFCFGKNLDLIRTAACKNKAAVLGFGSAFYLLFMIPCAIPVFLPAAVCGSVFLWQEINASPQNSASSSQ